MPSIILRILHRLQCKLIILYPISRERKVGIPLTGLTLPCLCLSKARTWISNAIYGMILFKWNLRANVFNCGDVSDYLCLYDDFNLTYSESCEKEYFAKRGKSCFKYLIKKLIHAFTD
jgi:hypothetical protein